MKHKRLDFLAAISGVLIALQARANGELSHRLDNGLQAALISFSSGLIIIATIALFNPAIKQGVRTLSRAVKAKDLPPWTSSRTGSTCYRFCSFHLSGRSPRR